MITGSAVVVAADDMDAAPYMMTNVNQASSTAPALLSTPHHHSPHQHPPPPHSIQIQYQSPPINHSVPLLATPMIGVSSIMDSHCLTSTPSGTFVNPTRLTSDNDPQQLQQPHVMILGMVATQPLDKGNNIEQFREKFRLLTVKTLMTNLMLNL